MSSLKPREVKRVQIKTLLDQGLSPTVIAEQLGCGRQTVYRVAKREDLAHKKGAGRPSKVSPQTKSKIEEIIRDNERSSTRKCETTLNLSADYQQRGERISRRSIIRYLHTKDWGKSRRIVSKPLMSAKNIRDRLTFALERQLDGYCHRTRFGGRLRQNILFTDESMIELHPHSNRCRDRIRTSGELPSRPVPKFSLKVMIAGGVSRQGKSDLVIMDVSETVTAKVYAEKILPTYIKAIQDPSIIPNQKYAVLQQDGAPCHTAKSTLKILD